MALVVKDRVKETTTTTGTGSISLGGAVTKFKTFSSALSNADTTYYAIEQQGNTDEFEIGIGTYTSSGNTLARTTILSSSNSNNAVDFSAGTKNIFITYPADKAVYEDASGNISIPGTIDGRDLATDGSKLDGIEASADVTDTANVTSAGALMDSEVTNLAQVKAFDSSDYATAAQGSTADAAMPKSGGNFTGNITTNDTVSISLGADTDLQLSHNNSNAGQLVSYTGEMTVKSNAGIMNVSGSSVKLQRLGSTVLEAYSNTVDITGNLVISGTVDGRDVATDGTKLDGIAAGATADQTASEILTAVKTVDGASSGLDADLLDGQEGSYYTNAANLTGTLPAISGANLTGVQAASVNVTESTDDNVAYNILFSDTNSAGTVQMTPTQDDDALTFNPSTNYLYSQYAKHSQVGIDSYLFHNGDTNTYLVFDANDSIKLGTNGAARLHITNSGVDVTGNITVSGTVDGKDVSTLTTATAAADEATALAIALG